MPSFTTQQRCFAAWRKAWCFHAADQPALPMANRQRLGQTAPSHHSPQAQRHLPHTVIQRSYGQARLRTNWPGTARFVLFDGHFVTAVRQGDAN
jgi:hypothetical protein